MAQVKERPSTSLESHGFHLGTELCVKHELLDLFIKFLKVVLLKEVEDERAKKLVKTYPVNVFDIEDVGKGLQDILSISCAKDLLLNLQKSCGYQRLNPNELRAVMETSSCQFMTREKLCTKDNLYGLWRAQAYINLVDLDLAEFDIKKALEIDPANRDVKLEYKVLKEKTISQALATSREHLARSLLRLASQCFSTRLIALIGSNIFQADPYPSKSSRIG
ncbi:hypothetical protein POM88_029437 [Heracleum sosnowskyi]|uniref:Uncharacterized protein n=1 Tax=Heracleum sosnowskyi TaxID=360622 RepID=A0AAD8HUX5_9APIA|nr:hypothetical protein POM88_029437 [Heracleum sosnowskyi]